MRLSLIMAAVLGSFVATLAEPAGPGLTRSEFIFESAPFPECHASTLVEGKKGLVAAWFGGKEEKDPSVGIWLSHRTAAGWTAPLEVVNGVQAQGRRQPCWNPVLFQAKEGPLLLFYKVGPSPDKWWGMLTQSDDGGHTWSQPIRLPDGFAGPIKNKPIQLEDGALLCPSSSEDNGWRIHFERTPDLGKTWTSTGPLHDGKTIGAIQPSLLRLPGGRLQAIGRTRGSGKIFTITSDDQGKTWGQIGLLELPNPNSGTDAVTLRDGRHLLVYNHSGGKRSQWDFGRQVLNIAVSTNGTDWAAAAVLENEKAGEFSYPAVIQTADGMVHLTYTWKRQRIRHVTVDPAKLVLRPIVEGRWPKSE